MRRTTSASLWISALCTGSLLAVQTARADDAHTREFVRRLNVSIEAASKQPGSPASKAGQLCSDLSRWALDLDAMLGPASAGAWERMDDAQRRTYRAMFTRRAIEQCAAQVGGSLNNRVTLAGVRPLPGGVQLIGTKADHDTAGPALLWKVRLQGGGLKAIDLLINGRSSVLTARESAVAVLERNANDVNALIDSLGR